jgi:hypothetical protein
LAAILHHRLNFPARRLSKLALNDPECQIEAGSDPAGCQHVARIDHAILDDIDSEPSQVIQREVMRCRLFSIEQSGRVKEKNSGAHPRDHCASRVSGGKPSRKDSLGNSEPDAGRSAAEPRSARDNNEVKIVVERLKTSQRQAMDAQHGNSGVARHQGRRNRKSGPRSKTENLQRSDGIEFLKARENRDRDPEVRGGSKGTHVWPDGYFLDPRKA